MKIYKKFVTPDFMWVELPELRGTPKQIAFANSIRDKYTDIFTRKLMQMNPFEKEEREAFTKKFINYVQHNSMIDSYRWIENHCPKCGCFLNKIEETSYCTNEYCSFTKTNANYTKVGSN